MSLKPEETARTAGIVSVPSDAPPFIAAVSPAMRALERVIAEVAPTDVPILLVGESGTGKEVLALELHRRSRNSSRPFVKCNCALAGSSLRMHLAKSTQASRDAREEPGTTFFDEISRLDPGNQDTLLQFLSEHASAHQFQDRVISSSTRNLEEEMRLGRLREELYYRINGVCLRVPSLRQRQDDVLMLLDYYLDKYGSSFERTKPSLRPSTMEFLRRYSWPGNIRELQNFARKLIILGDEQLALSDLVLDASSSVIETRQDPNVNSRGTRSLKAAAREASRNVERELILDSLARTHWNRKRTARELQISYKALLYKLKQLDIEGVTDVLDDSPQANGSKRGSASLSDGNDEADVIVESTLRRRFS